MLRNKIGPVFDATGWSFFLKIPLLSAGRTRFSKATKQLDQLLTQKGQRLDQFLTLQHICMLTGA